MKSIVWFIQASAVLAQTNAPTGAPTVTRPCTCANIHGAILSCAGQGLHSVPNFDEWPCPKAVKGLVYINFQRNELESLSFLGNDPTLYAGLQTMLLKNNRIESFDLDNFSLPNLFELNLESNGMKNFKWETFGAQAPKLQHLFLEDNLLPGFQGPFNGIPGLRNIYLQNNRFLEFDSRILSSLPSLVYIDVGSNNISQISNVEYAASISLESIYLGTNELTEFPAPFASIPSLKGLFLRDNLIENLDSMAGQNFSNLEDLDLGFNKLSNSSGMATANFDGLVGLNLEGNKLTEFPASLSSIPSLKRLYLRENLIENLDSMVGLSFSNLIELEIASNKLTNLNGMVSANLSGLEKLDVNDNEELHDVDILTAAELPSLSYFLVGNSTMIGCSCKGFEFFQRFVNSNENTCELYTVKTDSWDECDLSVVSKSCSPTTSPTPSPSASPTTSSPTILNEEQLSTGAIAGIAVGGVAVVALGVGMAVFMSGKSAATAGTSVTAKLDPTDV